MSEWISVKDKLPDDNTNVLVCNINGSSIDECEPVIAYIECTLWLSVAWWDFESFDYPDVTHWMPLPEPPKGD